MMCQVTTQVETSDGFLTASGNDYMECNDTCCAYGNPDNPDIMCFTDKNFTDYSELEETPPYELAVRWSYVCIIVFFGVLGNLAIILILFKNRLLMRTSVNYFILNMAISDLILASTGPITFTIRDTNQFWVLGELWCHLDGFVQVTVMVVSALSLCTISIDRLLGIMYPMHMHLKQWQAILIISFIWVLSALSAVPFYIYRNYGEREWSDRTEIYCNEVADKTVIYWLVIIVVLNWIPLITMIVCYVIIFLQFKKHAVKVEGREHPGILKTKKKFVKMLFTMLLVFILCWGPFQAFAIFREELIITNNNQTNHEDMYDIILTVTEYIIYLNPAINPFVYGLMHVNFKNGFKVTFPCFFKNKPNIVLVPSYGSHQAYAWNRRGRLRHTISSPDYGRSRNTQDITYDPRMLRRAFSYEYSPDQKRVKFDKYRKHSSIVSNGTPIPSVRNSMTLLPNASPPPQNENMLFVLNNKDSFDRISISAASLRASFESFEQKSRRGSCNSVP